MFNTYLKNNYGGKHFVMGVWQMGMTWIPPIEMLESSKSVALEHVRTHFARWIGRFAKALRAHKDAAKTEAARTRTGAEWYAHGLTPAQEKDRKEKRKRRFDIDLTVDLHHEILRAKGKGKKGDGQENQRTRSGYACDYYQ